MSKKSKRKKRGMLAISAIPRFVKEARDELKKVSWPTRQTTIKYTLIVIISSIAVSIVIAAIDLLFSRLLEKVL